MVVEPKSLDNIEIWRVWRDEMELDSRVVSSPLCNLFSVIISGIIHDQVDFASRLFPH